MPLLTAAPVDLALGTVFDRARRGRSSGSAGRGRLISSPVSLLRPELEAGLRAARYMYVTTYRRAGTPGTVPVWLWLHDGRVYFTTQRASVKARRIRNDGRVTVHVGWKDGPGFEGRAEWVDDRPDLEAALLAAYRKKYWLAVPLWMGRRIRKGLVAKTSVLIRITPLADATRP
jgi:PPOX class probable F420-dependent enzyme